MRVLLLCMIACGSAKQICTPGRYVFCRCADLAAGTQLCAADGQSFGECACNAKAEAVASSDEELVEEETKPVAVCERPAIELVDEAFLDGDTREHASTQVGRDACAAATSTEDSFALTPARNGQLLVEARSNGVLDPVIYIRDTDCAAGKQVACAADVGAGGTAKATLPVLQGKTYHVFVDGAGATAGPFTLRLRLTPGPVCGDGQVDPGEACDGGAGCVDCRVTGDPPEGDACPGVAVSVWGSTSITGSTRGYANNASSAQCGFGAFGGDRVYAVTARAAGNLKIATGLGIIVFDACDGEEIACGFDSVTVPAAKEQTYFVVIDDVSEPAEFTLALDLTPQD